MAATPIPLHVIHTVFQYILPPSLPLPPHLLSKRLTERHHFLSISPTDPASYLCWPSSDAPEVTEALERGVLDTLVSDPDHEVRYTIPDEETVLAHVRPDAHSPLQIVFAWDAETVSWRFHDARMLPFPDPSLPSLDAAPRAVSGLEWPATTVDQPPHKLRSASPAADDYWAGYESSGSSLETSVLPESVPSEEDDKAEAAYWASYAAVHGSGDSTMPSPKIERRGLEQHQKSSDARGPETTFDPFIAHLHLRLQQENGILDSPLSSPQFGSHAATSEESHVSEELMQTVSEPVFTGALDQDDNYGSPKHHGLKAVETSPAEQMREKDERSTQSTVSNCRDDRETGLREAIKGLYRLWKAQTGSEDAGTFIDIVKDTLEI